MPRWRSVWLVARREILERGRSRGFVLSVLFTTAIVIGSFLDPGDPVRRGRRDQDRPRGAGAGRPCRRPSRRPPQQFDQNVAITTYPDAAAADAALEDGPGRRRRGRPGRPVLARRDPLPGGARPGRSPRSSRPRRSPCGRRPSSTRATSTRRHWQPRSSRRRSKPSTRRPRPTRRASWSPTSGRCSSSSASSASASRS